MNRNFWKAVVACAVILLVFWQVVFPSGTWRYKMTVTVETPDGDVKGFAVREVTAHTEPRLFPEQGGGAYAEVSDGEAVVIDLGKRGVLFALMRGWRYGSDYNSKIMLAAFPAREPRFTAEAIRYYTKLRNADAVLRENNYPIFLYFKNIQDASSAELVLEPSWQEEDNGLTGEFTVKNDNFEKFFGKGVRLKEVKIETTNEPVTRARKRYMPIFGPNWVKWKNSLNYADPRLFNKSDFIRGQNHE